MDWQRWNERYTIFSLLLQFSCYELFNFALFKNGVTVVPISVTDNIIHCFS